MSTHRDSPSHILGEIDVRLTELERSSRLGAGAGTSTTPSGVPLERWPAMEDALSDVRSDLGRLAPMESDPIVRQALAARRQRLQAVLPALSAQQRPVVERLVAAIDGMTAPAGAGGLVSLPAPTPSPAGLALPEDVDDVLTAAGKDRQIGATSPVRVSRSPATTGNRSHAAARRASTLGTSTLSTSTRAATMRRATATRTVTARTTAARTAAPRAATSDASPTTATTGRTVRTVRTVTVTVTTVTTTTSGAARPATSGSVPSTTIPPVVTSTSRTVSTTTRTVATTTAARIPTITASAGA